MKAAQQNSPCAKTLNQLTVEQRKKLFYDYASHYTDRFRSGIDFQYAEKPRQVIGLFILFLSIGFLGFMSEKWDTYYLLSPSNATRGALLGVYCTLLIYCFLQTRDGLLVRPHPGVWRLIHASGLFYLLICAVLAVVPQDIGRQAVRFVFPDLKGAMLPSAGALPFTENRPSFLVDVFAGTVDLHCEVSLRTLRIQLGKMWFYAHIVGWLAKMCIFRDWSFCLILSVAFETVELSFQWLVPELRECWWDSIFLDVLLSNMVGMAAGYTLLRVFRSVTYNWLDVTLKEDEEQRFKTPSQSVSESKSAVSSLKPLESSSAGCSTYNSSCKTRLGVVARLVPFFWSDYQWRFFRTPERLCQATFLLVAALLSELNVFLLMYALDIPASHIYHKLRVSCLCFLAINGVAETFNYVSQGGKKAVEADKNKRTTPRRRIGHNAWLYTAILALEMLVVIRYGRTRFHRIIPNTSVLVPWAFSLIFFALWCFFHFNIIGPERLDLSCAAWAECVNEVNTRASRFAVVSKAEDVSRTMKEKTAFPSLPSVKRRRPNSESYKDGAENEEKSSEEAVDQRSATATERYAAPTPQEAITALLSLRKSKWKKLWDIGLNVVALPPVICFFPLLALVRHYDYD